MTGVRERLEFYHLLDLQKHLTRFDYDKLNLKNLDPLRWEVDQRVEERIALGKEREV